MGANFLIQVERAKLTREASRKSSKLFAFVEMAGKHWSVPVHRQTYADRGCPDMYVQPGL